MRKKMVWVILIIGLLAAFTVSLAAAEAERGGVLRIRAKDLQNIDGQQLLVFSH